MPLEAEERAAERFRSAFAASLGCLTAEPVTSVPKGRNRRELKLVCAGLECPGAENLTLRVRHSFTVRDDPRFGAKCHSLDYAYHLLRADDTPLLRYECHPGVGRTPLPHLHVHATDAAGRQLDRLHLPTGRVSIEAFVRLVASEYGAPWRGGRTRCEAILRKNQQLFDHFKTW